METTCNYLSYEQTNLFSKLVIDYLQEDEKLVPFFGHPVSLQGIKSAIEERNAYSTNRVLLVDELKNQYSLFDLNEKQSFNIDALLHENTFTVTTAHQPNIFTGPLYFIYKILHAIKLADELKRLLPEYHFVPVYYMGSEDADLDELGHIYLDNEKIVWETDQTGAVGRMKPKGLEKILQRLEGEFGDLPFGQDMVMLCKKAYTEHNNIQQATLYLVNELFKEYGLIVLIPDNANLKKQFQEVVKKELIEQFSYPLVQETIASISKHYKVQAGGREVNLFYLSDDGSRDRIEVKIKEGNQEYVVVNKQLNFSEAEILEELELHPERFSPNVILRGVSQEMILPNIAFIGGGGELAYWLELKKVFDAVQVPYPMLILRNSFLIIGAKEKQLQQKLGLNDVELFLNERELMNLITKRNSGNKLSIPEEQGHLNKLYEELQKLAADIDPTLKAHVAALHTKALKGLQELEKKLLRAERRKQTDKLAQLTKLRTALFPNNNLQERIDNFMPLYANYGKAFIEMLYKYSLALKQKFAVIEIAGD